MYHKHIRFIAGEVSNDRARWELALDFTHKVTVSPFCEISTGAHQLRGFVQCEVCGFGRQADGDEFRFGASIKNADGV